MEQTIAESHIDLIALAIKSRGVRCKTLLDGKPVTLRPKRQIWREVSGQILTVKPSKVWIFKCTTHMSGELLSARTAINELNLVPLRLEAHGQWVPKDEYWGEAGEEINQRFRR